MSTGVTKRSANSFPDYLKASFWGKFTDHLHPNGILLSNLQLWFVMSVITAKAVILSLMPWVWAHVDAQATTIPTLVVVGMVRA